MADWIDKSRENWLGSGDTHSERPPVLRKDTASNPDPHDEDRAFIFKIMRCPHCQGEWPKVYSTKEPVRYHKCQHCGKKSKSIWR